MSRIAVTGLGVISALGNTLEENHSRLKKSDSGLTSLELFKTRYANSLRFGEIKRETAELKDFLKTPNSDITRTTLLALHAAKEALHDSGLDEKEISSSRTALISGSTVGGMCLTDELYHDANRKENGSPFISSYDCGSVSLFLQSYWNIGGIINTINTACSSSANAIQYGARLIQNGLADRVLVGGSDALAKFTINGFNSLNILSSENCQPFDADRKGLNLGEGAGYLVLEKEENLRGRIPKAFLSGYANANDAFHPSSLSETGDGPLKVMRESLSLAKLSASDIGYINAHGTGTENNDRVESRAMITLFGNVPSFVSSKSKIGHTLGASAAIEAIFGILALQNGELYPSHGFKQSIPETNLIPVLEHSKKQFQHFMSNSFGFGGNCSSLIFSKNEN